MMSLPYALFFYGAPILAVLLIVFTSGAAVEHRRCRSRYYTDEDLRAAEREGYQLGIKHGYHRALRVQQLSPVSGEADHGT